MSRSFIQRRLVLSLVCLPLLAAAGAGPAQQHLHYCRAPDWAGEPRAVVAWQQGPWVIVQAARQRDALPGYLFAGQNPPQPIPHRLELPSNDGLGLHDDDGRVWLRVSAGLKLACEVTHED